MASQMVVAVRVGNRRRQEEGERIMGMEGADLMLQVVKEMTEWEAEVMKRV